MHTAFGCYACQFAARARGNSAHFNDGRSTIDDRAFSVKDMPYFAGIGSNDGMLHLHGTEDYQHLALFHCIAIVCPNLDNGTSHRCREYFLRMGDITAFRGSVYVRGLTSRQLIKTPVEYDFYPFFEALYIGSRLACFPPE